MDRAGHVGHEGVPGEPGQNGHTGSIGSSALIADAIGVDGQIAQGAQNRAYRMKGANMANKVEIPQSVTIWGNRYKAAERAQARTISPLLDMWDDMNQTGRNRDKDGNITRTWTKATIEAISDKTGIAYNTVDKHLKQANRLKLDLSVGWVIRDEMVYFAQNEANLANPTSWAKWDKGSAAGLIAHLAALLDKPANNANTDNSGNSDNSGQTPPNSDESGESDDTPGSGETDNSDGTGETDNSDNSDNSEEPGNSDNAGQTPPKAEKPDKTAFEAVIGAIETIRTNIGNLDKSDKDAAFGAIASLLENYGMTVNEGRLRM